MTTVLTKSAALIAAVLLSAHTAHAASLLKNGDFEMEGGGLDSAGQVNVKVPLGWIASDAYVADQRNNLTIGLARTGDAALYLDRSAPNEENFLLQAFDDVEGEIYTVDFWLAGRGLDFNGDADPDGTFVIAAVPEGSAIGAFLSVADAGTTRFLEHSFTFTGTGRDVLIMGAADQTGAFVIDDISIAGMGSAVGDVPEPATWAMLILGFASVGASLRRRRRQLLLA